VKGTIVWFTSGATHIDGPYKGRPVAQYRTKEEPVLVARARCEEMLTGRNLTRRFHSLTPPCVIAEDHPNYKLVLDTAKIWQG
jgi:hypothetical protein